MSNVSNEKSSSALSSRINLQSDSSLRLNDWIMDRCDFELGRVLELCAGTGSQSRLLSQRSDCFDLICVDANQESLNILVNSIEPNRKVSTLCLDLDDPLLLELNFFDTIICCYGLYYSVKPISLFTSLMNLLSDQGTMVIVGPIAGNNRELFSFIESLGCTVPESVLYSSEKFMLDLVESCLSADIFFELNRAVNKVRYSDVDSLLTYWKNSTFYDENKERDFLFKAHDFFSDEIFITKSIGLLKLHKPQMA